ncbi:Coenzyme F420 hydrogenase/dehydrogenase, beta subunit C-terminal domain [Butyrivibrio sp. MB2005]|uniref:Coenzyme F420 hydrogenase/dehydrogenase, beta subunit C-terminal domain n=1 Tax=Butyrivibrio sp. MB2005 TaxID=1280678 RepID=UPI000414259B|nr:Coenzyme F420 hydrogenase/dehydrogenase, beta subunit C-terminal domain [Butyrivibrio sp. MB2005]
MVDAYKGEKCNGCKMCADICPKHAISFRDDEKGFWYPIVNYDECIRCNLCEKKCPHNNEYEKKNDVCNTYAAWLLNDEIRLNCTSGGVSYAFNKYIVDKGGYAVGCRYTKDYKGAEQFVANNNDDLLLLTQSKYLQSDTQGIYRRVKELLDSGKLVIFTGAPCHNSALNNFLGKEYENLIQVEFICLGISSPYAHRKYIDYLEEKFNSKVVYFKSKDKRYGWNNFGTYARFENGEEYFSQRGKDPKTVSYHQKLTIREACEKCKCKSDERAADITIADFWGIEQDERNPYLEHGTSAIIISSNKGQEFFNQVSDSLGYYEKTKNDVIRENPAFLECVKVSKFSTDFFKNIGSMPYDMLVEKYTKQGSTFVRFLNLILRTVVKHVKGDNKK